MTISDREKRLLMLAGVAIPAILLYVAWAPSGPTVVTASPSRETIPAAEQRLLCMRQSVARVPGKEEVFKQAASELSQREKGLIQADTAPQATEQLLGIVRKIARAQAPPLELRAVELGQPAAYGDAYGQVSVAVSTECRIEQVVNMLADLADRPELVGPSELRMGASNPKEKTVGMRMVITGLVARSLVPKRKEAF